MTGSRETIGVTILGSTGSIGGSTLQVLARHRERFRVVGLSANQDVDRMLDQCAEFRPMRAVMAEHDAARALERELRSRGLGDIEVGAGPGALVELAAGPESEYVMAAIVGAVGLLPSIAAASAGKRVLLANKEALVMAGPFFTDAVRSGGAELLPIDSEHNAIFQCLPRSNGAAQSLAESGVCRILLTASGGPFRTRPVGSLESVTPDEACAHPNWEMGRKISVDSATLMNKGLELIEASWLFSVSPDKIDVVIHPQSVIHSMVAYTDGSVLAQMGNPDMRTPIAHALAWPERIESGVAALDLCQVGRLDFEPPDARRFPCLALAQEAARVGGTACAVLNAANEIAVDAFLQGRLGFTRIFEVIETTMENVPACRADTLEAVLQADTDSRRCAREQAARRAG